MALVTFGGCGLLWGLTVLASKLVLLPTVAWAALALLMTAWFWLEDRSRRAARRRRLEGAIASGRVDEVTVTATEAIELEEIEDLGQIWALQVAPAEILIVANRQDVPRGFPTDGFSLTTFLGAEGEVVEVAWALRGARLRPARTITVDAQRTLRRPEHLERLTGRLDELERLLEGSTQP